MKSETEQPRFGLKESVVQEICRVFATHPLVDRVIIYGSRAKGNYRNGSDIDLTVQGEAVSLSEMMKIETELDDLLLPYKIDLSLLHKISDTSLLEHIKRVGAVFYDSGTH